MVTPKNETVKYLWIRVEALFYKPEVVYGRVELLSSSTNQTKYEVAKDGGVVCLPKFITDTSYSSKIVMLVMRIDFFNETINAHIDGTFFGGVVFPY